MDKNRETFKKLTKSVITIVTLSICLCITTSALVLSMVSIDGHLFSTGEIDIDLNGGKPVIEEHEFIFKPGMTVVKDFYIENNSTWDVYYKIYFDDISGGLSDVLEVTIRDGEKILFAGKPSELTRQMVSSADDILSLKEKRELKIEFNYPNESENSTQDSTLSFTLCADAVQTKNNHNKEFN